MEQAGAEVLTLRADIASESSLKPVLDELRQKFGQINGIIHAAGAAGFEFMTGKDIQAFKNVTSPKIEGTWLLDKLTAADDLDFFILFSSVVTLTGGAGQSDYTAANSYLDSFAAYRNRQGKRTISINWPVWEGVGMANLNPETYENMIFKTVSAAKALKAFEEILAGAPDAKFSPVNFSRVIYGELNYKMLAAISEYLPFKLSEQVSAAVKKQTAQFTKNKVVSKERSSQKATVIGLSSQDEEQTAYILAQIWAQVLGLDEIDVNLSIYEQGGDSILASQLLREIDRVYPKILKIADIFSYPTVSKLASYIDSIYELSGSQKPGAPMRAMDTVLENRTAAPLPDSGLKSLAATDMPVASPSQVNPFYNLKNYQLFEVDQAETKVLQIKLQNEITCYLSHALPLCVVLAHPKLVPWYYEHFVDIYSVTDENDFLKVDFLEYRAAYKEMMYEVYLGYNLLKNESDIIQFIIDKINLGYYVIIHADEYYLPVKALYHKEHYVHHSIIYGYHNGNKQLLAIGFNAEQIFTRITFDYDTFVEAYEQGKYHYQQSAPWAETNAVELLKLKDYQEEYPFDIKRFLGKLDGYLSGRGDDTVIFSYNWKPNQDKIAYGIKVYQQIINHLENFLEGRFTMDYRAIHLLTEHKKSIYNRLEFILNRYRIKGTLEKMVREYAGIVADIEALRRKFMGQHYALASNQLDKNLAFSIIKESLQDINLMKEKEEKLLTAIYQQIKREI
jgi:NAD(P)-dependent dehydrogenase (short-subunit alcohol dehydrogenase family)